MTPAEQLDEGYVKVAEVEIDAVQPARSGFVLTGRGQDRADYRLEMELDMPIDRQTRAVLGELLAQSEWRVLRRAPQPFTPQRSKAARKSNR
ncbi:MAG: hypothetical protein GTN78_20715 [Gemmatimonadales bacterium]|nr:hypothetical protein [Gemmatimonadales bacterium]NIN10106.1 hypothetical protein [Gemmatimonadales bacterium]NIR02590.1 hypothetical protein [Gemmatimonadales bacterium]NIS66284.1 hypothetical protein [Gemmatimonadales bacterium]